ncbi:putative spermidine/putrescine transport system permease protein [Stella humosa]|uniref:Putative spermidine/putrescine transport system permease protein n=1 Tax=Stella humosa TaxID=94 RepID=A0A3N1MH08_9PROT|nr:ABC transporter permease [Stella humosa]ROQ01920.1 putative spermidine/putrescine transport system permease protein [Stella humosa]BBK32309.1 polyamine ABC transporter permease [Stella humosa]
MGNSNDTAGQRVARLWLWLHLALVMLFLLAPIVAIAPLSFSAGSFLQYPLPGLSLRWYVDFFTSAFWLPALGNSIIVAIPSTLLATVLGTLAAIGLWLAPFPLRGLVTAALMTPMVMPIIVVAVGVYFAFAAAGLANSYLGLILAHTALGAPFVVVTVQATLAGFDRTLMRAGASLGAGPWTVFRRVMLPLVVPGVASGALFAFATSFDEVVVAFFLAGAGQRTLPRQMFAGINENISLTIAAAATMLVLMSVALMAAVEYLRRRGERLRRGAA